MNVLSPALSLRHSAQQCLRALTGQSSPMQRAAAATVVHTIDAKHSALTHALDCTHCSGRAEVSDKTVQVAAAEVFSQAFHCQPMLLWAYNTCPAWRSMVSIMHDMGTAKQCIVARARKLCSATASAYQTCPDSQADEAPLTQPDFCITSYQLQQL